MAVAKIKRSGDFHHLIIVKVSPKARCLSYSLIIVRVAVARLMLCMLWAKLFLSGTTRTRKISVCCHLINCKFLFLTTIGAKRAVVVVVLLCVLFLFFLGFFLFCLKVKIFSELEIKYRPTEDEIAIFWFSAIFHVRFAFVLCFFDVSLFFFCFSVLFNLICAFCWKRNIS